MTDNEGTPADTLTEWLSARSDDELAELLRLRPDLTIPPPPTLEVLAGRSEQRASVLRAAEDLDTTCLTVVELLAHEGADTAPVARARLDEIVGRRATKKAVDAALSVLRARALVRGTTSLTLVAAARDAVPWRVGRFFDVDASLTAEVVGAKLAEIDDRSRELLTTLTRSSSIGRTRDAAPGTPADRPVQRLLAAGLLTWLDDNTVELPPQVSQVLRGEPVTDPVSLAPPAASTTAVGVADVDAAAAGEALELLRHCEDIVDSLSRTPAPALKAGDSASGRSDASRRQPISTRRESACWSRSWRAPDSSRWGCPIRDRSPTSTTCGRPPPRSTHGSPHRRHSAGPPWQVPGWICPGCRG